MYLVVCVIALLSMTACAGRGLRPEGSAPAPDAGARVQPSPRPGAAVPTLETADPRLTAALARAVADPAPVTFRAVAVQYWRHGVFDRAHQWLGRARELAPADPATLDAIARLWRDSGFPQFGLAEAYRAVFHAPDSPAARNTLGTILQALGRRQLAQAEYERVVALDPRAAYAHNNLCYSLVLDGEASRAVAACRRALALDSSFQAARNNLALAHAIAGDSAATRAALAHAGDPATELYNTGIIHLAQRQYASAVDAFTAAHAARPTLTSAIVRAQQAARLAAEHGE